MKEAVRHNPMSFSQEAVRLNPNFIVRIVNERKMKSIWDVLVEELKGHGWNFSQAARGKANSNGLVLLTTQLPLYPQFKIQKEGF